MKKRILSLLLCIVMCLSLMPIQAFAMQIFVQVTIESDNKTRDGNARESRFTSKGKGAFCDCKG